jgi:hypothetical protein
MVRIRIHPKVQIRPDAELQSQNPKTVWFPANLVKQHFTAMHPIIWKKGIFFMKIIVI